MMALAAIMMAGAQDVKPAEGKDCDEAKKDCCQKCDTARFMRECRQFNEYVINTPFTRPVLDSLNICQDTLIAHYRAIKPKLNDRQVQEYNTVKGRFDRRKLEYHGEKVGQGLQATGDSIAKAAGRVGRIVGGYFKGIFGQ